MAEPLPVLNGFEEGRYHLGFAEIAAEWVELARHVFPLTVNAKTVPEKHNAHNGYSWRGRRRVRQRKTMARGVTRFQRAVGRSSEQIELRGKLTLATEGTSKWVL